MFGRERNCPSLFFLQTDATGQSPNSVYTEGDIILKRRRRAIAVAQPKLERSENLGWVLNTSKISSERAIQVKCYVFCVALSELELGGISYPQMIYTEPLSSSNTTPRIMLMNIICYLKPQCGWSNGVRAIMKKYNLSYEDKDIIGDPAQRAEMVEKSGQQLSPCVEIDGVMLPDISGAEVETYLLKNNLVQPTTKEAEAATHAPCASHGTDSAVKGLNNVTKS